MFTVSPALPLPQVSHAALEELASDIYDEMDRREADASEGVLVRVCW